MSLFTSTQIIHLSGVDHLELVNYKNAEHPKHYVLALPGLGSSSRLFEWVVEFLPSDTQVSVLHPHGIGNSSKVHEDLEMEDVLDEIIASFFEGKNQTSWHFWGVSFGGFMAQLMASKIRPASLSLFCTTSSQKEFVGLNAIPDRAFEAAYTLSLEKRTRASAELSVHPETLEDKQRFEEIVRQRQEPDVPLETVLWQNREARKFLSSDFRFDQLDSDLPVLVMGGEDDRLVPAENFKCFKKLRPETKLDLIKSADHLFFMEHPKIVAERLFRFIETKA